MNNKALAQITLSGSSTTSICPSSGSITITASSPSTINHLFEIISGPVTRPQQASGFFDALPSGSYTILVTNVNSETSSINIVVSGNYVNPSISLSGIDVTCVGSNGEIYVQTTGGRGGFTYQIISPVTVGPQTSDTFKNLSAGTYTVQATDSCGQIVSDVFTIDTTTYGTYVQLKMVGATCDSITGSLGIANYQVPLNITYINPATLDTFNYHYTGTSNFTPTLPRGLYNISFTDTCGRSFNGSQLLDYDTNLFSIDIDFACPYYNIVVNEYDPAFYGIVNPWYSIISGPVTRAPQDTNFFDSLVAGSYILEICDSACDTCFTKNFDIDSLEIYQAQIMPSSCLDSTGTIRILFHPLAPDYIEARILSYPPSYTGILADTFSTAVYFYNVTYGLYTVEVKDSCGFIDTVDIFGDNLFYNNPTVQLLDGCAGTNSIRVYGTYNTWAGNGIQLRDSTGGYVSTINFPSDSVYDITFNNLPDGKYIIRYRFLHNCPGNIFPPYESDTVTVKSNYSPVQIDQIFAYTCQDTLGQITAFASAGKRPYTYEIISGPVTFPPQSDSNFYNLPTGTYTVRVLDSCGISDILGAQIVTYGLSNITATGTPCVGQTFSLLADTLPNATYVWTGPNSFVDSSRGFTLSPFTANDTGTYYLEVKYGTCIDTIIPYHISPVLPNVLCLDTTIYLNSNGIFVIDSSYLVSPLNGTGCDSIISINIAKDTFNCQDTGVNFVTVIINNILVCTATVRVYDTIPPNIICQDITIYLDSNGNAIIKADSINNGSYDNCSLDTIYLRDTLFTCNELGLNQTWLIGIDVNGNIDSCISNINVIDTINPIAICKNDTLYLNSSGLATLHPDSVDNGSLDNCFINSKTISKSSFTCSDIGLNQVTLIVFDQSGNADSCNANILILDTISPTIICPISFNDTLVGICEYKVPNFINDVTINDNCNSGNIIITQTPPADSLITIFNSGDTILNILITYWDSSLNSSSCNFDIFLTCIPQLIIPEFISPNGDGLNDIWFIKGLNSFDWSSAEIYNRYGSLVFSESPYQNNWGGVFKSGTKAPVLLKDDEILPSGTYFYKLEASYQDYYQKYIGVLQIHK